MAGSVNAGSIIYEVDMDTARLLSARREVDAALNGMSGSMGRLDASVARTERSVASMQRTMSGLSGVAKAVVSALSIQQVAQYGNEWVTVNNKLANSVRANEQLVEVTQRVFDISQNTMSSLTATATLYGRLERATRSAGTSTKDLITLTSTINKGLAVSGATTEEASSTMTQLSQALASGVLRGEEFNSISENGSRLAVALADSLGVTIGQLRGMAAQGKLTTEVVVNGLLKQSGAIAKEFANTTVTMGQAFTIATNNITKFVGESSSVSTTIRVFNDSVITLSQNLDIVANAIAAAAVIFGSRFAGALALATKARIDDMLAAKAQAKATAETAAATANAARVTALKAGLDKEQALSNLALAQTEYNVAKGTAAEAFALDNLIAKKSIAIQMSATHAETQLAEAAATRTATAAAAAAATTTIGGLARGALGLIGGPAGVAVIAAAGLYYFYQKAQQARQESIEFASTLDTVISKMKEMGQVQLKGDLAKTADAVDALREKLADQTKEQDKARDSVSEFQRQLDGLKQSGAPLEVINDAQKRLTDSMRALDKASSDIDSTSTLLGSTLKKQGQIQEELNQKVRESDAAFKVLANNLMEKIPNASSAAITAMVSTMEVLDQLKSKASDAPKSQEPEVSSKAKELIKNAERRLALSKLEGEARAKLQAQYDAEDAGIEKGNKLVGVLEAQYAETERNSAAKKANTKEANANANAQESISQKLAKLKEQSELAGESTRQLSRDQAILTAQQSLGSSATPDQVKLAGEYAAAKWDTGNAIRAQAAAEKLLPESRENASYKQDLEDLKTALSAKKITQQQADATSEQLEKQHQINIAKIRAQQAVSPAQEAVGTVDPVQQLANQNAQKLALIQQFEQQRLVTEQQGLALRNAANTEYEQQRIAAQWEIYRSQSESNELLATAIDSLQGGASNAITGLLNGTQSLGEAFANIGSTILNSVVSSLVQMGLEWVKSQIIGQTAQQAAILSNQATSAAALASSTAMGAASAATLLAAYSPAAMAASIATSGGAAAAGLTGYATAMTAAQTMSLAGMREHGGPVNASSMYRVGEGGKPEIFKASNGSQYMILGDNGKVISNSDLGGGGGSGSTIQQEVHFHITTTNGIDDATINKMAGMMKQVALYQMKDQSTRPGGMLQGRKSR
jgi:tape measure domain-containing protein